MALAGAEKKKRKKKKTLPEADRVSLVLRRFVRQQRLSTLTRLQQLPESFGGRVLLFPPASPYKIESNYSCRKRHIASAHAPQLTSISGWRICDQRESPG